MPLSNPMYIDQNARHMPSVIRTLDYQSMEGMEGVLLSDHLRVIPLGTPGAGITCLPGVYAVNARHTGGEFEAYIGKVRASSEVGPAGDGIVPVSPVSSAGSRTDLVILRIENPYVVGDGSWGTPADTLNGPYGHVRVIEGVSANINHVSAHNATWSAITLARITRPLSTGIVNAGHITDLRSLANPAGQRIIITDTPPSTPPPIAQELWSNNIHCSSITTLAYNTTTFTDWPSAVSFEVPFPKWATEVDFFGTFNPQYDEDTWGELRFKITPLGGSTTYTDIIMFDENVAVEQASGPGPQQLVIPLGMEYTVPNSQSGKLCTVRPQIKFNDPAGHPGDLATRNGVYFSLQMHFKRYPN